MYFTRQLTQFIAQREYATQQGARSEMAERSTFKDETFFTDRHFHSSLQDQYEIVGRFSLIFFTSQQQQESTREKKGKSQSGLFKRDERTKLETV